MISPSGVSNWDTVAAVNLSEPSFCEENPLHLDVITTPGSQQGRTVASNSQQPNVNVCLNPNVAALPNGFSGIFRTPSKPVPEPDSVLGLLVIGALGAVLWRMRPQKRTVNK